MSGEEARLDFPLRISKVFEVEISLGSVYVRLGAFERFYNTMGFPEWAWPEDSY